MLCACTYCAQRLCTHSLSAVSGMGLAGILGGCVLIGAVLGPEKSACAEDLVSRGCRKHTVPIIRQLLCIFVILQHYWHSHSRRQVFRPHVYSQVVFFTCFGSPIGSWDGGGSNLMYLGAFTSSTPERTCDRRRHVSHICFAA